ncbi:MAG: HNH endonuclease [Novosphingobium sp.]
MSFASLFLKHADGTILDAKGRELFLGLDRFKALVKDRHRCFLCGEHEDSKRFNDEHVIPDWVQRTFDLHEKKIRLSNGSLFQYSKYKIRCCAECNTFLGATFEKPISEAISAGPEAFLDWFEGEVFTLFIWVNLIFLKVHLKDNELRLERNLKAPDDRIGDLYDWAELHHCHAMLRAARFGFAIDTETTLGSIFCLRLGEWARAQPYDYNDHLPTHTVMIRLGEIAFICALNDACGVFQGLMPKIEKLPPELNAVQLLEILTEFQFVNAHLKYRPTYRTELDVKTGDVTIVGSLPELFDLKELDFALRGDLMIRNLYGSFENFALEGLSVDETRKKVARGDVSFLPDTR